MSKKIEATVIVENILKPMIQDILLKSMMKHFKENDADTYIIKSILYLALDLKYNVVAEGIETEEQYRFLEKNNCESGQGFLMSKPVPIEDVYEKLENAYSFKL